MVISTKKQKDDMTIVPKKIPPREVPEKDSYYLGLAFWIASKSKDPDTQVGSLIITEKNIPLGWGYNGPPRQIPDTSFSWARGEKDPYLEHAEENAVDFSTVKDLTGSTLYCTHSPCPRCMRKIVKQGIKRVVYFVHKNLDPNSSLSNKNLIEASKDIASKGGVTLVSFDGNLNWMRDRMLWMEKIGVFD